MLHGTVWGEERKGEGGGRGQGSAQSQSLGLMSASKHNVVVLPAGFGKAWSGTLDLPDCEHQNNNAADTLRKYSSLFISLIFFTCMEKLCVSYR